MCNVTLHTWDNPVIVDTAHRSEVKWKKQTGYRHWLRVSANWLRTRRLRQQSPNSTGSAQQRNGIPDGRKPIATLPGSPVHRLN